MRNRHFRTFEFFRKLGIGKQFRPKSLEVQSDQESAQFAISYESFGLLSLCNKAS